MDVGENRDFPLHLLGYESESKNSTYNSLYVGINLHYITLHYSYGHPFILGCNLAYLVCNFVFCFFFLQNVDLPGLSFGQQDYYPYVFFKLNLNLLEK